MSFGQKLKELRVDRKITQEQLAKVLNLKRTTISGYETDKKQPDFDTLIRTADFFGVSLDYLVGRTLILYDVQKLHMVFDKDIELTDFINNLTTNYALQDCVKNLLRLSTNEIKKLTQIISIIKS